MLEALYYIVYKHFERQMKRNKARSHLSDQTILKRLIAQKIQQF